MAGEVYGSPGFAFTQGLEGFLLNEEKLKHQKLVDEIAQKREAHQEEIDKIDADLRKQELEFRVGQEKRNQRKEDLSELKSTLADSSPGDILDKGVIDEARRLNYPVRLGPIPQRPVEGQPPASLAENPTPPETMANVPMSPDVGRPYLGSRQDAARQQMGDLIKSGADPRQIAEGAIRLGVTIPPDLSAALGEGTLKAPHDLPQYAAYSPDGKEVPGVVQTDTTGKLLLNGVPIPSGVTVKRVPAPRDPLMDREAQLRIQRLQQEVAAGAIPTGGAVAPVDPTRPSGPKANVPDAATGLTPAAVFQNALTFGTQGKLPQMGMGTSRQQVNNARMAIQNKAAAIADAAGVNLPTVQAEYHANAGALGRLVPQAVATANAANAMKDNLELAVGASAQVPRTGARLVNRYMQWAQGELTPATGLSQLEVYIYTASREYAKVTSGGALSARGLTDSAQAEAEKLLNAAQAHDSLVARANAMTNDANNVIDEQTKGINRVSGAVGNFYRAANGLPPEVSTGTGKDANRKSLDDLWNEAHK